MSTIFLAFKTINIVGKHNYVNEIIEKICGRLKSIELIMVQKVIRWNLKEVMASRDMTNKRLAELTGMQPVSISQLRSRREPTRIDVNTLDKLCEALDCLPGDLIQYIPDKAHGTSKKIAA